MHSTPNTPPTNWPITLSGVRNIRKEILVGKLATFVEQAIRHICEANTWTIGALNVQEDHAHLFLNAPPSIAPSQIAHTLKGTTAHKVFQCFPEIKKQLWGGVNPNTLRLSRDFRESEAGVGMLGFTALTGAMLRQQQE